jgi:hypothetical protein
MLNKNLLTALATLAAAGAFASPALASGGGGGGGGGATVGGGGGGAKPKPVLPAPAIAPGTFDGIGPGPVYIHDSFGSGQNTRYRADGSIVGVLGGETVNGIRAEYPNNKTETWSTTPADGPTWTLTGTGVSSSPDPFEPYTPLQETSFGYGTADLMLVGDPVGSVSPRPSALLPFAAPTTSATTVSGDVIPFVHKTAIGFSTSSVTTKNFETAGQAWLEVDDSQEFGTGVASDKYRLRWQFHTGGLNGTTLSGDLAYPPTSYTRAAVSYDPVNHVAAATLDGNVVASVPYIASTIKYVGVEGNWQANVDNFTVRSGTVTDPPPAAVAPPVTPAP